MTFSVSRDLFSADMRESREGPPLGNALVTTTNTTTFTDLLPGLNRRFRLGFRDDAVDERVFLGAFAVVFLGAFAVAFLPFCAKVFCEKDLPPCVGTRASVRAMLVALY
jgi:hypothetical protein